MSQHDLKLNKQKIETAALFDSTDTEINTHTNPWRWTMYTLVGWWKSRGR